jgi:hypothetical protein
MIDGTRYPDSDAGMIPKNAKGYRTRDRAFGMSTPRPGIWRAHIALWNVSKENLYRISKTTAEFLPYFSTCAVVYMALTIFALPETN